MIANRAFVDPKNIFTPNSVSINLSNDPNNDTSTSSSNTANTANTAKLENGNSTDLSSSANPSTSIDNNRRLISIRDQVANPKFVDPEFTFDNKEYDATSKIQIQGYIAKQRRHIDNLNIDDKQKEKLKKNIDNSFQKRQLKDSSSISSAENCTIETAKKYGVYPANGIGYFNDTIANPEKIKKSTNDFILNNKTLQPYSVCSLDKNKNAYENCSLSSAWWSLDDQGKCGIKKGECPPGFKYNRYQDSCEYDGDMITYQQDKVGHCSTTWYDWMMIPNFHLGNQYTKYRRDNSDDPKDITRCFKPCLPDFIPYDPSNTFLGSITGSMDNAPKNQCVFKNTKGNYCPIALINLLYTSKDDLKKYYSGENPDHSIIDRAYTDIIQNAKEYISNGNINISDVIAPRRGEDSYRGCYDVIKDRDIEHTYHKARTITKDTSKVKDDIKAVYGYSNNDTELIDKHYTMLMKAIELSFNGNNGNDYSNTNLNILRKINKHNTPITLDGSNRDSDQVSKEEIQNDSIPYSGWFDWLNANKQSRNSTNIPYEHHSNALWIEMIITYSMIMIILMFLIYTLYVVYSLQSVKYVVTSVKEIIVKLWTATYDTLLLMISTGYVKRTTTK
tara:strand:+ start:2393 stop:4243 length:1851 start_codon:yes stop_codon:yes gene_type:complete